MSVVAPSPRLGWRLLPAVLAAAAAVIAASLVIAAVRDHPAAISLRRQVVPRQPGPSVVTTPWRIASFSVGAGVHLSGKDRARFETQKPRARATARAIAHALTLGTPERVAKTRVLLTPAAARSVRRLAPGMPKKVTEATAVRRSGQIGLQAPRYDTAVARLEVTATGMVGARPVRWKDTVVLWLTRKDNVWRAIAFDIDRKPR